MSVTLVRVPYHLGRENVGLAKGVPVLAEALDGLVDEDVSVLRPDEVRNEIGACFDVVRAVRERIAEVVAAGRFPLVLAGNCHSSLGTVAALDAPVGVVWLDAHADLHTPETSESGFMDGMALALLTGAGWAALRATIPGHVPVPRRSVALVGARDLDAAEEELIGDSAIRVCAAPEAPTVLDELREQVEDVYLHIDLDVLDPSVGRANWWAAEGGLSVAHVHDVVDAVHERFTVRAAALTAYQPDADTTGSIPAVARTIAERVLVGVAEGVAR